MILGLDIGDERVGVAIMDVVRPVPVPIGTYLKAQSEQKILGTIDERKVTLVVVGLPLNDDGTEGPQCQKIRKFVRRLRKRTEALFDFIDEYGSSEEAAEIIRSSGKKISEKGMIDAMAATIILQRYLASKVLP